MNTSKQNKTALWIIVLLVALNLSILSILWIGHQPRHPNKKSIRPHSGRTLALLQQEMKFTDEQIQQYDRLRQQHAVQTRNLIQEIQHSKKQMMDNIMTGSPDSAAVHQTARHIGQLQSRIEELTFHHFLDLKDLCDTDQAMQLHHLIQVFYLNHPPGPGPEHQPRDHDQRRPVPPPERPPEH